MNSMVDKEYYPDVVREQFAKSEGVPSLGALVSSPVSRRGFMQASVAVGGGLMLAFGLGTLPNLLLAGLLATRLQAYARQPAVRLTAGLLILGFGIWGLMSVPGLARLMMVD